jgi:hypothetical protein
MIVLARAFHESDRTSCTHGIGLFVGGGRFLPPTEHRMEVFRTL